MSSNMLTKPDEIIEKIIDECCRAAKLHPNWPTDPIHASAILNEEAGELTQAVINWFYHDGNFAEIEKEALQTGAMVVRFLVNINRYKREHPNENS